MDNFSILLGQIVVFVLMSEDLGPRNAIVKKLLCP